MFRSRFWLARSLGALVAAIALGASGVGAARLRADAVRAAKIEAQAQALSDLRQAHAALLARLDAEKSRGAVAASLPQLRAMLATLRSHDSVNPLVATLKDAFASEVWWEQFRRDAVATGVAFGGGRLDMATDPRLADLDLQGLIVEAVATGNAAALVGGRGFAAIATAHRVSSPGRDRPAVIVLANILNAPMMAAWLPKPADALAVLQRGQIVVEAGDAGARAGLTGADPQSSLVVAKQPMGDVVLALAADGAAATAQARAGLGPAALVGLGLAVALLSLWLGFRRPRSGPQLPLPPHQTLAASPARTAIGLGTAAPVRQTPVTPARQVAAEGETQMAPVPHAGLGTVGRYTLIDKLGEGGMAQVFTAVSHGAEGFQRKFVVKRLRPELASNKAAVAQFIDEAKLGSSLVHSNIIPVFDFGKAGDEYFMAMEYILGRDLGRLIDRRLALGKGPVPLPMVAYVAAETLKALDYAHTRRGEDGRPLGLVHRDVSPSNVLLSLRGEVKLLDFGIVKAAGRISKTEHGMVKGNLSFMSPEQARGQETDARSDIFSLGLVLHFCAAGRVLYQGNTAYELLLKAAAGPSEVDWRAIGGLPAPLPDLLRVALQSDPSARFPSAAAFSAALAGCPQASSQEAAAFVHDLVGDELAGEESRLSQSASSPPSQESVARKPRLETPGAP